MLPIDQRWGEPGQASWGPLTLGGGLMGSFLALADLVSALNDKAGREQWVALSLREHQRHL